MKSREEMAWEIFLKFLEQPHVCNKLMLDSDGDLKKLAFQAAYSTAYDYIQFINGDLK